ncbi:MAG: HAD family phosphatase [Anaerolineales bacterium]|nr:HAD family phosphatase [Anaerolineales bacterium]
MAMYAVIWDLDGTLADSEEFHFAAWQEVLGRYGVEYRFESFIADFGRNNFEILSEHAPTLSRAMIAEISDVKEAVFRRLVRQGPLHLTPGAGEWLDYFRKHGVVQIIGSSAPMANILTMVDELEIGDALAALSGARIPRGKPDPMLFLRCAAALETPPHHCLVIEDSIHGIEAAKQAGMPSVAIGRLVRNPALAPYLSPAMKPRCVATPSLAQLSPISTATYFSA